MFKTPQIVLFSKDLSRAADFYKKLGFEEVFRTPSEGTPIHVDLVLDGYRIGLASEVSTRDDHGLVPVVEGQRAAVILWTDDTGRRTQLYRRLARSPSRSQHPGLDVFSSLGLRTRMATWFRSCSPWSDPHAPAAIPSDIADERSMEHP
jgi:hypothetical protein